MINYDSPTEIRKLLEERNIRLKKRWGQNFLINRGAREKIVGILKPERGSIVWEIGPGLGALTELILECDVGLVAFEIDRGLCRYLDENFGRKNNFFLVQGDFLKTWKHVLSEKIGPVNDRKKYLTGKKPERVAGNLPYSSASQIIASFIKYNFIPKLSVFTLQKDLVKRMVALPSTKEYSSFSVLCQYAFHIKEEGDLQPGSFYPVPDVISSVVSMTPRENVEKPIDEKLFFKLVKSLFASKRKTLRNNLLTSPGLRKIKKSLLLQAVEEEGITSGIRSEELPPDMFIRIANRIVKLTNEKQ